MWPFRGSDSFDLRSARPYWLLRDGMGDAGPGLDSSLECDVAIIGAGISGALVADGLVGTGKRIVMLDRGEPGQGSTAASTALLQYEIDTHLVDLTRMLGADRATLAYRACVSSFDVLERRFPELLAPCDYQRVPSLYVASKESAVSDLRAELAARRAIGIHVEWQDETQLRRRFGCRRPGGILSALAATIDPLRLTRGVLAGCVRHGVSVYSRTEVERIEEQAGAIRLHLAGGHTVTAQHVVVAAGYESLGFLPYEVADIDNTFALVTEPLPDAARMAALPLIWESARPYIYMRGTPDGRILLGGADVGFKNPAAREALLPRQVRKLAAAYQDLTGMELPKIAFTWAGSFATTRDGLPYIGRMPGVDPRIHFALCFGGNGITYSLHAPDIIRAGILGQPHALDSVFGGARLPQSGLSPELGGQARRQSNAI
jgi:glycine/D-amino acid oxidase-like deaminating enzyme